ncbi:MAG: hypothetical protein M3Y69_01880, partial [Verrucomicrobiota bacterium]|nr:hypothetical protein [Verrucomicrobiota bacterium]
MALPQSATAARSLRAVDRSLTALQAALNGDALIKAVFALLRNSVRCDFVNVWLRVLRRGGLVVPNYTLDSRGFEFDREVMETVFVQQHPGMPTLLANPGIRFVNTREILPPEKELRETRFYREVMQVVGFRHAAGIFFWENRNPPPWAIFSLCRADGEPDFSDEEIALLDRLYPQIDAALRRVREVEKERAVREELRSLVRRAAPAVCIVDWDLQIAEANRAAREQCARWTLGTASRHLKAPPLRLPERLQEACGALKAHWSESLRHKPAHGEAKRLTVVHPEVPSLRATVSLHVSHLTAIGQPAFVVDFETVS